MGPLIVDSNFFIQAHRDTYPLDVATSFWQKIGQLAADRRIMSIDKVKAELARNKDALTDWCCKFAIDLLRSLRSGDRTLGYCY